MCDLCAKGFLITSLTRRILTKYQISTKLPQISQTYAHQNLLSII